MHEEKPTTTYIKFFCSYQSEIPYQVFTIARSNYIINSLREEKLKIKCKTIKLHIEI